MNIFNKYESWLAFLFGALYFLFPTILFLSNLPLLIIIIIWASTFKNKNYWATSKNNPVIWILCSLYFLILIGIIYTPSNWILISVHLSKYLKFLFAVIIILILTKKEKLQNIALNAFIVAMLLILLSTWLNIWFLLPWSKSQNLGWGQSHYVVGDYITQNVMMAFFTIVAIHKAIQNLTTKKKIFWIVISILSAISITHLSEGRTGLLLLLVAVITYTVIVTKGRWLIGSLLAILIASSFAFTTSSLIQNRFVQANEEVQKQGVDHFSSIGHRLYNYKITPMLIAEKPLFGHGTGAYHTEICRFVDNPDWCPTFSWHPHNQFLFLGADHGLIGVALYLSLIISLYYTAFKSPRQDAKIFLYCLASILLVDSLFNTPFYSSRESDFFSYMIGLLVSMSYHPEKDI